MEKQPKPQERPDPATITPYENRIGNAMGSMRPRDEGQRGGK